MTTEQLDSQNAYRFLPYVYDDAGFADYAKTYTPLLIQFLHQNDWIGRRILEFGCGTGASVEVFCERHMVITAIDSSKQMIERAEARFEEMSCDVRLVHGKIQRYQPLANSFDLVFCLDVLNYVTSIRDIEHVFRHANQALELGKVFLFDLQTIRHMAEDVGEKTAVMYDNSKLFIVARHHFDYDLSTLRRHLTILYSQRDGLVRKDELHIMRGYPLRAILGILSRTGFEVQRAVDLNFEPLDEVSKTDRIVIVAQKAHELE